MGPGGSFKLNKEHELLNRRQHTLGFLDSVYVEYVMTMLLSCLAVNEPHPKSRNGHQSVEVVSIEAGIPELSPKVSESGTLASSGPKDIWAKECMGL